jgi:hypothetical protein
MSSSRHRLVPVAGLDGSRRDEDLSPYHEHGASSCGAFGETNKYVTDAWTGGEISTKGPHFAKAFTASFNRPEVVCGCPNLRYALRCVRVRLGTRSGLRQADWLVVSTTRRAGLHRRPDPSRQDRDRIRALPPDC